MHLGPCLLLWDLPAVIECFPAAAQTEGNKAGKVAAAQLSK